MSRLAAMEKGQYYPTPLSVVDTIASYLSPARGQRGVVRLFDPCCGEGLALEALGEALARCTGLPVQTWGVEISPDRVEEAATRLDLVIQAPFEAISWSPVRYGIASVLFLNPPYDHNGRGGRMEMDFLKMAMPALVTGGVLAYLIPTTAVNWSMAEYLYENFEDIQVFRFGDADDESGFDRFKQIVVLATRRKENLDSLYADRAAREAVPIFIEAYAEHSYGRERPLEETIPTALPEDTTYPIPVARKAANLRRARYTNTEIGSLVTESWSHVEAHLAAVLLAGEEELPQPLKPPKTGHIAQIVAAGLAGLIETDDEVFKGRVVKVTETRPDPDDESKEIEIDRYETHVVSVSPRGLEHMDRPKAVEEFLQDHIEVFKRYIAENFQPYGNDTSEAEARVLATLSLDKQLPGVAQRGLLDRQREDAVALTRAIQRYGVGHLVAEMGFGKTRVSLAAVELMGAYPTLVICPPHLVDKWAREATAAVPGAEAHIVESISELEWLRSQYRPGQKLVVIASRSKIKLGPGWRRTSVTRYTLSDDEDDRERFARDAQVYNELRAVYLDADEEPHSHDKLSRSELRERVKEARRKALEAAVAVPVCPQCGAALDRKARNSRKPALCARMIKVWNHEEAEMKARKCEGPLFEFGGPHRRWPLADYICKKMRGFFRVLVADEVHQYKAKDSDQGWAFGLLARHIPAVITLTGTFFGGPASSIFWLLHRTQGSVRSDYGFDQEKRWVRRFGILQTTFKTEDDGYGHYNAKRRRRVSTKERPGISPAIVRYTLPTTIFAKIKDLGIRMPEFHEDFITFPLTQAMDEDLSSVWNFTWAQLKEHWPHYTSAWLQWNLARPNSCFRPEVIEGYDGDVLECPAVVDVDAGELLPKEEWLVSTVEAELAAGRKVVVYLRQTGTRDIRSRLVQVLTGAGVNGVVVLNPSISPRKRERWLQENRANVLITNPRLVETGLDLVQYATVVFYEVEYSLYTIWQSCRRVWRLGQTRPVKVYYLAYESTLEEKAYALIGQKVKAAQLLYGEEVASALVEDAGDASLVMALVKAIEDGEEDLHLDQAYIFADTTQMVTDSVVGSPVLPSMSIFEQWLVTRGLTYNQVIKPVRRRRKASPGQLTLI